MSIPCPHCTRPVHRTHRCTATLPVDPPVPPPSNLRELIEQARLASSGAELRDVDPVVQLELDVVDPDPRVAPASTSWLPNHHPSNRGGRA